MPKLTTDYIKNIIDDINKSCNREKRKKDKDRFLIYNGSLESVVEEKIRKEYTDQQTVSELLHRLMPVNIPQKIINKLGMVYKEPPSRKSADDNSDDDEKIDQLVEATNMNFKNKFANRYFKLNKKILQEYYLDENGMPSIRNLPAHTYEVYSTSKISPEKPDLIVKIIVDDISDGVYHFWTSEEFLIVNSKGMVITEAMVDMDGTNPYGTLPFGYVSEAMNSVNPISDDDLLKISIAVPVILSDLSLGQKYQAWSMIYTVGAAGDLEIGPNKVANLDFGPNGETPQIGQVKPSLDTEQILKLLEFTISMLLSTKNLSTSNVKVNLSTENAASGVSKMLDQAESVEDREDQEEYFRNLEKQFFHKMSKYLLPYWTKSKKLNPELSLTLSDSFEVNIHFKEPKILKTYMEKMEESVYAIKNKLSTLKRELKKLNPNMKNDEIDVLVQEIKEDDNFLRVFNEMKEANGKEV